MCICITHYYRMCGKKPLGTNIVLTASQKARLMAGTCHIRHETLLTCVYIRSRKLAFLLNSTDSNICV